MSFLTSPDKRQECRIGKCYMDAYLSEFGIDVCKIYPCDNCPMMPIVNKLAEYEDKERENVK